MHSAPMVSSKSVDAPAVDGREVRADRANDQRDEEGDDQRAGDAEGPPDTIGDPVPAASGRITHGRDGRFGRLRTRHARLGLGAQRQ